LCISYSLETAVVLQELTEFRPVYRQLHKRINMDDMLPAKTTLLRGHTKSSVEDESGSVPSMEEVDDITITIDKWLEHSFIKPLRVLGELSGFNSLSCLYKNLASLAVTSCSAERAMSRVKIVKDRLRSTMLDDWFSALLVLAAEKDLLDAINENDIIDKFASCSLPLQKQLIHGFHHV